MADPAAPVGVVAIGRNEGERFRRCLASLPYGIPTVYVDSGSTDGSVEAANASGVAVVELDVATPFTAARARNEGWRALLSSHANLAYVQFIDGDCELQPGWLEGATRFLETHPEVAVACGRRRERFPDASIYNTMADSEWNTPVGEADSCGGDALIRRSALEASGGFNDRLVAGEEPEMCARLRAHGAQIFRIDAPMTIHDTAIYSVRQYWRRAVRSGFGYAQSNRMARVNGAILFRRQRTSAWIWGLALPLLVLASAPLSPFLSGAALALYLLQLGRLSWRMGPKRAALVLVAKFAEVAGMISAAPRRSPRSTIDYKV